MNGYKWSELGTPIRRPHSSQLANSNYMLELRVYVQWRDILALLECQYYWIIKTGMTENGDPLASHFTKGSVACLA